MKNADRKTYLIRQLLLENSFAMMISLLSINIASVVDGIVISRFLGMEAISALGLTKPVVNYLFFALTSILSAGYQILCAKKLGEGRREEATQLFSTAVLSGGVLAAVGTVAGLLTAGPVSRFLGASGSLYNPTREYLIGWYIGLPGFIFEVLLQPFIRLDGGTKRITIAVTAMTLTDIVADLLAVTVFRGGMLEIALATALSYYVFLGIMLTHFLEKDRFLRFSLRSISWNSLPPALRMGVPSAVMTGCNMVKTFCINRILLTVGGTITVSAFSVWCTWSSFVGTFETGVGATLMLLAGIWYGEHNTGFLRAQLRMARQYAFLGNAGIALVSCVLAPQISTLFFGRADPAVVICIRLCAVNLPLHALCSVNQKYLQGISDIFLANVMGVMTELALLIPVILILGRCLGTYGIWVGYSGAPILALFALELIRILQKKNGEFLTPEYLADKRIAGTFTLMSLEDVPRASQFVQRFCMEHTGDSKQSVFLAVAVEEITRNTIEYAFEEGKRKQIDLRITAGGGKEICLRLIDNCSLFDPEKYYREHHQDELYSCFGIRMAFRLAKEVRYVPLLRRNNIIIIL